MEYVVFSILLILGGILLISSVISVDKARKERTKRVNDKLDEALRLVKEMREEHKKGGND